MTTDGERLIERAFCLKQASLDSVHEKNVRHGHISTLHIWPARRPLAACRAALIATLLPDPGSAEERRRLLERLGGGVVQKVEKKKRRDGRMEERIKEETHGGILHWGREDSPDLAWFRAEIRKAYGGRAPRVLDPFAGGGAIPLEAMRLGCEVTAVDINPVAWFILKCTLEYPQKLAGKMRPLPEFVLADEEFMAAFRKANPEAGGPGRMGEGQLKVPFAPEDAEQGLPKADLAWHVRAWGRWVLARARRDLARYYPVYATYEPLKPGYPHEQRELKLVPLKKDGTPDVEALNAEFSPEYLADGRKPRWVAKPTVAYLWARTVRCKNCRAEVPLLKTRWLCKKEQKRVLLTMEPNAERTGVSFGIQTDVPQVGGNAAQRRAYDKKIGAGTMSRSGATCPCCGAIMTTEDIRLEGQAGRLGAIMTAVVVDGLHGKEYRLPMPEEIRLAAAAQEELERVYAEIPFGLPEEPTPKGGSGASRAFSVDGYGFDKWYKLFTPRQLLALGTFVKHTRAVREIMQSMGYQPEWVEAVSGYLALAVDRLADYSSAICSWHNSGEKIGHTFGRFALPIVWDYAEVGPISETSGGYLGALDWIRMFVSYALRVALGTEAPNALRESAIGFSRATFDLIITDPPYYDAIPYSDLMDFFYVWLRRTLHGLSAEIDEVFREPLAPKWDHEKNDGELIDDASRHGGDKAKSKAVYEEGMFRAFQACYRALTPEGRLVIVFAHKQPDAWETLVSAIIRAGFMVDASWPIQTEMGNRTRALSSAALSSSVWLVCRKRPAAARPGWDNQVLAQMRELLYGKWDEERKEWLSPPRLHEYWDAGIRGPDFVWAATGPALAAYSKYPVVKKANEPGQVMTVSEFLRAVRRLVVDFVVGRVLSQNGEDTVSALDDVTTYYLLHRHDFGLEEVPAGACILYAVSCGLSDRDLADQYDLIVRTGGQAVDQEAVEDEGEEDPGEEDEPGEGSGSTVKLKPWQQRKRKSLGFDAEGRPAPLIDQVHRLMHLWKAGDVAKVDDYLDQRGLRRNHLFHQLLQALIELAKPGSEERSLLESISNHVAARGPASEQEEIFFPPGT
ncbi:MAG: putative methylase [Bacillota bacterium]|jgi:adenine-specific DNA methylase|nr:putative methylase [Bacillota bacterium]